MLLSEALQRLPLLQLEEMRKNEDPRLSFSTPEFKEAQRMFGDGLKVSRHVHAYRCTALQHANLLLLLLYARAHAQCSCTMQVCNRHVHCLTHINVSRSFSNTDGLQVITQSVLIHFDLLMYNADLALT